MVCELFVSEAVAKNEWWAEFMEWDGKDEDVAMAMSLGTGKMTMLQQRGREFDGEVISLFSAELCSGGWR